jgi:hypothetical protein
MPRFANIQLLNQNALRSYPLTDAGSGLDKSGTIKIPDDFIVELYFPAHAGLDVAPDLFFIRELLIDTNGYNIGLGYNDGSTTAVGDGVLAAVVGVPKSSHTENQSYALAGVGDFSDCVGTIAIGSLNTISTLSPGKYYFAAAAAGVEAGVIWPMIRGISSISVINGADRSAKFYGDIEFVAGNNMRITTVSIAGQPTQIVFSAISGEGLNQTCDCTNEPIGEPIRFINGIPPLPDGNFRMVGDGCIELLPITNGIQLNDKCSTPCCGCIELDAIVANVQRFADERITLQTFVANLTAAVTQMSLVLLGSRLSDNGCLDCG